MTITYRVAQVACKGQYKAAQAGVDMQADAPATCERRQLLHMVHNPMGEACALQQHSNSQAWTQQAVALSIRKHAIRPCPCLKHLECLLHVCADKACAQLR